MNKLVHMDYHKNGGSRCNRCNNRSCSAGIVVKPKGRIVLKSFTCPGHKPIKYDMPNVRSNRRRKN